MPNQGENTRDSLVDAAIRVFAAKPAATLAEIADAAGVRRVTLHRLFGSRDDLLREIAIRSLEDMDAACKRAADGADSYTAALRAIVESLVPVGDRFHFLWTQGAIWSDPEVSNRVAKDNAEMSDLVDRAKTEGGVAAHIPNAWILSAIEAVVFASLSASRAGDIAVNDAGRLAAETLFDGISGTKNTAKSAVRKSKR